MFGSYNLRLDRAIDRTAPTSSKDVITVKEVLRKLGFYRPPGRGLSGITDESLFDGIKKFQKNEGLTPDGVVKPAGPTVRLMGAALWENSSNSSGSRGKPARTITGGISWPAFSLTGAVGQGGVNNPRDVLGAKRALAWAGYYPREKAQEQSAVTLADKSADVSVDPDFELGIAGLQRDFNLKRDQRMDPRGPSATILTRLIDEPTTRQREQEKAMAERLVLTAEQEDGGEQDRKSTV